MIAALTLLFFFPQYDEDISPLMTWGALEKLVDRGLIKNIGLSNFNSQQTQDILDNCRV